MQKIKIYLQKLLGHTTIYQRLKASYIYDVYWCMVNRKIIDERDKEVKFYRDLLKGFQKNDLVYDIGANHGYKTDIFMRLGARVIAVDPDTSNQKILRQKFLSYRFQKKPITVVGKAVSDQNSIQTMWIDEPGSAKNTLSQKWVNTLSHDTTRFGESLDFAQHKQVQTITLEELIATHGQPFFVKIDVEGHEPNVLQGLQQPLPYLSFEVNLPEFMEEGLRCIELLEQLAEKSEFNYSANLSTGLSLQNWLPPREFLDVYSQCKHKSIEIFCRTVSLNN